MTDAPARTRKLTRNRTGGWVLVAAQCGYAVGFAVCVSLALARAAELTGHAYVPSANDALTADADIMTGWSGGGLITLVVSSAMMTALIALLLSVVLFLRGYTTGHPALTRSLIGSTMAMLLVLTASLTPAVQSISGWLLD